MEEGYKSIVTKLPIFLPILCNLIQFALDRIWVLLGTNFGSQSLITTKQSAMNHGLSWRVYFWISPWLNLTV